MIYMPRQLRPQRRQAIGLSVDPVPKKGLRGSEDRASEIFRERSQDSPLTRKRSVMCVCSAVRKAA